MKKGLIFLLACLIVFGVIYKINYGNETAANKIMYTDKEEPVEAVENEILVLSEEFSQLDENYSDEAIGDKVYIIHNNGEKMKTDYIKHEDNPLNEQVYGVLVYSKVQIIYTTNMLPRSKDDVIYYLRHRYIEMKS